MFRRAVSVAAAVGVVLAGTVTAQGTTSVSGQVTILERPGEPSEDLGNVVVYLEPIGATARRPVATSNTGVTLQSRQFQPHVRVVTEGSKIEFKNEDPFSHNVFSKMNGGFDTGVYGRGKVRENVFTEPGVYPLYCNVHPRMTAYVVTLSTPYYTQAAGDGRFALENVVPGRYRMHVWHDRANEDIKDLTVPSAGMKNMRVELDARGYKYVQHKNKFGKDYTSASGDRY